VEMVLDNLHFFRGRFAESVIAQWRVLFSREYIVVVIDILVHI